MEDDGIRDGTNPFVPWSGQTGASSNEVFKSEPKPSDEELFEELFKNRRMITKKTTKVRDWRKDSNPKDKYAYNVYEGTKILNGTYLPVKYFPIDFKFEPAGFRGEETIQFNEQTFPMMMTTGENPYLYKEDDVKTLTCLGLIAGFYNITASSVLDTSERPGAQQLEGAEYRLALSGRHSGANLISNIRPHDSNGHCFGLVGTAWHVVLKRDSDKDPNDVSKIQESY